jgi:hypothetical protein
MGWVKEPYSKLKPHSNRSVVNHLATLIADMLPGIQSIQRFSWNSSLNPQSNFGPQNAKARDETKRSRYYRLTLHRRSIITVIKMGSKKPGRLQCLDLRRFAVPIGGHLYDLRIKTSKVPMLFWYLPFPPTCSQKPLSYRSPYLTILTTLSTVTYRGSFHVL